MKTILKPMEVGSPMDYFQFRSDCKNEEVRGFFRHLLTWLGKPHRKKSALVGDIFRNCPDPLPPLPP